MQDLIQMVISYCFLVYILWWSIEMFIAFSEIVLVIGTIQGLLFIIHEYGYKYYLVM